MIGIIIFVGAVTARSNLHEVTERGPRPDLDEMDARDGCMPDRIIYREGLDENCEHLNISAITAVSHSNMKLFYNKYFFNSARLHVTNNW